MAKQNDDIFPIDDLLFGDEVEEPQRPSKSTPKTSSKKKSNSSNKKSSKQSQPSSTADGDKFSYVHEQEAYAPRESTQEFNVVGVGLYSLRYKIAVSALMIACAAAIGGLCLLLGSALGKFVELNWFYTRYVAPFVPLFNVVVMVLYYVIFAVRPYDYGKNGTVSQLPKTEDKTYRKMHSMYYTTKRALFVLALLAVLNVTFLLSANFLYGVIANG